MRRGMADSPPRMTPEEYVVNAIRTLRGPESTGIHSRFSGFNRAFRIYFPDLDPVETTTRLAGAGIIAIRPARGGVMLYLAGEGPVAPA
jgi:hypothetical protein